MDTNGLTCFKCFKETSRITYEENRIYKVSCECGCSYEFEHSSMKAAIEYHYKMVELYGEIDQNKTLRTEIARLRAELAREREMRAGIDPDRLREICEAERAHDEWECMINAYGELEGFMHTKCGHQSQSATNYCSNCGHKMAIAEAEAALAKEGDAE